MTKYRDDINAIQSFFRRMQADGTPETYRKMAEAQRLTLSPEMVKTMMLPRGTVEALKRERKMMEAMGYQVASFSPVVMEPAAQKEAATFKNVHAYVKKRGAVSEKTAQMEADAHFGKEIPRAWIREARRTEGLKGTSGRPRKKPA